MFLFIKQKIKNQIWLSACLLMGLSLLVAVFCCSAMFQRGSLDRILQNYFSDNRGYKEAYPALIGETDTLTGSDISSVAAAENALNRHRESYMDRFAEYPIVGTERILTIYDYMGSGKYSGREMYYRVNYAPGMEEHVTILDGEMPGDADLTCMVSERVLDVQRLTVGDTITFAEVTDTAGIPLTITVTGVFGVKDLTDSYWCISPYQNENELFLSRGSFEKILSEYSIGRLFYDDRLMLDYTKVNSQNIDRLKASITELSKENRSFTSNFEYVTRQFTYDRWPIIAMFLVLQLPILGMILPFIYMVSSQIALREQGEIAMLKSRGIYRKQVLYLYFIRTCLLAGVSVLLGIPLGYLLCKIAAKATDFLVFNGGETGDYIMFLQVVLYALGAMVLGIICIMIPVIKHSKVSIVEFKATYNQGKKMFWQKTFLDVILMAVSVYLVYAYKKSLVYLEEELAVGEWTDPLVFLNSCIFIVAAGLFAFRIMQTLVKFLYRIGKKRWKTVSYAAFLQITRSFRKQMFITIFMIMTVAIGLFYANAARTLNHNKEDRVAYGMGSDVRFKEFWVGTPYIDEYLNKKIHYEEPDYSRFSTLMDSGLVESYTRVLCHDNISAVAKETHGAVCQLFAIETNRFGKTASLKEELQGDHHWYYDLNALAEMPNGVIISSNLAKELELEVDSLIRIQENHYDVTSASKNMYCKVVAVVDAWPGYEQYVGDKESYLVVVNLSTYMQNLDLYPYEIWVDLKDGASSTDLRQYLNTQDIRLTEFRQLDEELIEMKKSFKLHITNGLFSLTFMIAITLCAVGFLIYWISSIGQRELLFGVYRAMGLSVKEINRMLVIEHLLSTVPSVLAGGVIGILATYLFSEVFAMAYLPEKSNVPIQVYVESGDMIRLFVLILAVVAVCMWVLRRQIKKLNIAQALKLGED